MIRGMEASVRGMNFEQARTDTIANNVANVNTDGFKRSVTAGREFAELMVERIGDPADGQPPVIGPVSGGSVLGEVRKDNTAGAIMDTGRALDVALTGSGEFTFQGPNGPGYTRNGSFHRDSQGRLVTAKGDPVLAGGQPIGAGAGQIEIAADGQVLLDGKAAGRLDIQGGDGNPLAVHSLEKSNVDMAQEMTDMIVTLRSYQANQRALSMQDTTLSRTVNDIGKV